MHSLGLVKTQIDQGLEHGTTMRLFPDTTFLKVFCFSRHFPDFRTYHKIPDFFLISRPGGDLSLSEFCINQILGRSYFSLRKGDLFSLVSLQTMIGMGMVEREAVGQVGGRQKLRR